MHNRITALIVAGMDKNWARHQMRDRGHSLLQICAVSSHENYDPDDRVTGNILAIEKILNALEV
jgi:hypothetical protein